MSSTTSTSTTPTTPTAASAPLCTSPSCPSTHPHNTGYYNFANFKDERTRTNKLPKDFLLTLKTINKHQLEWIDIDDLHLFILLAKFAVVHQSHLPGLMPLSITQYTYYWKNPAVQQVLESAKPRPVELAIVKPVKPVKSAKPVTKPVEPVVKTEVKKTFVPGSRLKNAMGRGPIFTGKPLALRPIPVPKNSN